MAQGHLSPLGFGGQGNDPFLMLRREMEQLFDNVVRTPSATGGGGTVVAPRMDISEDDKEIRVVAEMPGAAPDNVEVMVDDDVLTIRGEREQERETNRKNYHLIERSVGVFQRSLRLPSPVDASQVQANFDNGVLTITIPKTSAKGRSRQVQIRSGGTAGGEAKESRKGAQAEDEGEKADKSDKGGDKHH
ncbi:MAG TPA: Hsp20/alpha crystallin family protein [Albitalea sp.]|jgi:HSP20 family protein|nr:Hsp20/alpha crystallin family protein [Albitalea sp.]